MCQHKPTVPTLSHSSTLAPILTYPPTSCACPPQTSNSISISAPPLQPHSVFPDDPQAPARPGVWPRHHSAADHERRHTQQQHGRRGDHEHGHTAGDAHGGANCSARVNSGRWCAPQILFIHVCPTLCSPALGQAFTTSPIWRHFNVVYQCSLRSACECSTRQPNSAMDYQAVFAELRVQVTRRIVAVRRPAAFAAEA